MLRVIFTVLWAALVPTSGWAVNIQSNCLAFAEALPGLRSAALGGQTDIASDEIRLHFVGHSTYVLETNGGIKIATDYNGFVGRGVVPDVVTMNRAHESHYTDFPDPAIEYVLRGWGDENGPADHRLDLDEILIRNVTTDIRSGLGGRIPDGNSIFIFEVAGLCIGHLGHLHHEPSEEQYAMIGRLDVVMAPIDGGMTLDTQTMIRVLKRLRASVVLPMHWFGNGTLGRFLNGMQDEFAIEYPEGSAVTLSLRDLPRRPTIMVLTPQPVEP